MQLGVLLVFGFLCQFVAGASINVNTTLSDAISIAEDGDTIILPSGVNFTGEGNVNLQLFGRSLVFLGDGTPIIDCNKANVTAFLITTSIDANLSFAIVFNGISFFNCDMSAIFINTTATDDSCNVYVWNSTFSGNSNDDENGGAIYTEGLVVLQIDNVSFVGNWANDGSAVYASDYSTVSIYNSEFTNNYAQYSGTVSIRYEASVTISDCSFRNNYARYFGGAIDLYLASYSEIKHVEMINNVGYERGGAVSCSDSILYIFYSSFQNNHGSYGGAIASHGAGSSVRIWDSEAVYNFAVFGGGVCADSKGRFTSWNTTISHNNAVKGGGVAAMLIAEMTLHGTSLTNNTASDGGGGAYVYDQSKFYTHDSIVDYNSADDGDSIYCNMDSSIYVNNSQYISSDPPSTQPMGVYCDPVPEYQWCTFHITDSGDWSQVCPDRDISPEKNKMAGWKIALIVIGCLVGAVLLGFAVAYAISSRFEAPSFFNKLRSNSV